MPERSISPSKKWKEKYCLTIGAPAGAGPTGKLATVIVPNTVYVRSEDGNGNVSFSATASAKMATR